jgi:hypothetical protein
MAMNSSQAEEGNVANQKTQKARLDYLEENRDQWALLKSVLDGHYEEIEKLTKKSPSNEVTDLALKRINTVIKDTKKLLAGDPYIDSIDVFVAAGDMPQLRDVLMVLRELIQGMERRADEYKRLSHAITGSWNNEY